MIFTGRRKTGHLDLEAVETAVRSAMHCAGAAALTELLQFPAPDADRHTVACPCGRQAHYRELRAKPVLTAVGPAKVSRPYYLCAHCHTGQFPVDVELDIDHTEVSPGVRRMQALVGQEAPFDHGREQMRILADLEVTTKAVERTAEAIGGDIAHKEQQEIRRAVQLDLPIVVGEPIPILYMQMDGTGVPVVKKETEGCKGKSDGQPAHTREAKLGCVFTQTGWDEEGYPMRDADSTTYTGAIETADEFGKRLYLEAWKRGWSRAAKKVVIGDGAEWIWNIAKDHFPGAIQIVDLYHARQHLWELARKLHPNDQVSQKTWIKVHQKRLLDKSKIEKLVAAIRSLPSTVSGDPAMRTGLSNLAIGQWIPVAYNQAAPKDGSGKPQIGNLLTDGDRILFMDALAKQCDPKDGAVDGMIFDQLGCNFDPEILACKAGQADGCIAPGKIAAIRKAFAGPKNAYGTQVYPGFLYDTGIATKGRVPGLLALGSNGLFGPYTTATELDVDKAALHASDPLVEPASTNLSTFSLNGGKLIFFHGVSDPWFSALDTLGY